MDNSRLLACSVVLSPLHHLRSLGALSEYNEVRSSPPPRILLLSLELESTRCPPPSIRYAFSGDGSEELDQVEASLLHSKDTRSSPSPDLKAALAIDVGAAPPEEDKRE